jgi:RNA polymerase sigma factor (sigma-70 family)
VDEASDEALLAGLAAGDASAATAFVRRFQSRVFGVAVAVVGDRTLADDISQEAFVRAWRAAATFDSRRGSVAAWLLAIARHAAIDAVRAERSRPVDHLDHALVRLEASDPDPAAMAVGGEERRRIVTALRTLPAEQRRAVVLASFGGRTAQELGEIDDIPLGTAKTRIRTGLRRLREVLEPPVIDLTAGESGRALGTVDRRGVEER